MAEAQWRAMNPGGFPKHMPKLSRKQWNLWRQGKLKDIYIDRGGGKTQLLESEITLLKSLPKLKKNETNTSFKNRVKSWESITGITHPNRNKGLSMSHRTAEGKALAGEARVWGLNKPTDYSQTEDWADQVKDLEYQKMYDPNKKVTNTSAKPLNAKEIEDQKLTQDQARRQAKYGETYRLTSEAAKKFKEAETDRSANTNQSTGANQVLSEEVAKIREALKTDVFTRHYKTGEELGVMTRRERLAYEKEAGTRTFEQGVADHQKATGGPDHLRETSYKSSQRKKLLVNKQTEASTKASLNTNKTKVQINQK